MICNYCGLKNNKENKYCINCGEELTINKAPDLIKCSRCGFENKPENKFCISCGNKLQDKTVEIPRHQHNKSSKQKIKYEHKQKRNRHEFYSTGLNSSRSLKIFWITTGAVIAVVLAVTIIIPIFNQNPDIKEIPVELKSTNPVVETKVYEIASKFVCSCGNCNEESLEICKCERAVEERQFIRDYLEQNQKSDDIVLAVANRYGWLKALFASSYNVDPSKIWNPNGTSGKTDQLLITKDLLQPVSNLINTKATISDKISIYSAFNCPCGKCGIDELKDCNCDHPGGAKAIKRFVDEKISENKYTVNEITDMVNNQYGGKKI